MSKRLIERLKQHLIIRGKAMGTAELSLATGKGQRMIERYIAGQASPSPEICRKLALACGFGAEEALLIAQEPHTAQAKTA